MGFLLTQMFKYGLCVLHGREREILNFIHNIYNIITDEINKLNIINENKINNIIE